MIDQGLSYHFTIIPEESRGKILNSLYEERSELNLWLEGEKYKERFLVRGLNKATKTMSLISVAKESKLVDKKVLVNFAVTGMPCFSSGKLTPGEDEDTYHITLDQRIYKCERRKSFRLPTYPNHNAEVVLEVNEDNNLGNVLSFNKKSTGHTGIFKKFLDLLNESEEVQEDYKSTYRVLDLSATGLSVRLGVLDFRIFEGIEDFHEIKLHFNGQDHIIPHAKVTHIVDYLDSAYPGITFYKMGLEFVDLDLEKDNELSKQIAKEIKINDFVDTFEEFLK